MNQLLAALAAVVSTLSTVVSSAVEYINSVPAGDTATAAAIQDVTAQIELISESLQGALQGAPAPSPTPESASGATSVVGAIAPEATASGDAPVFASRVE